MSRLIRWLAVPTLLLVLSGSIVACPLCKESIPEAVDGAEGNFDGDQQARAWNNSILFMLSMPYVLLGAVGLLIYRGYRSAPKSNPPADDLNASS
jgi:hypothetical protein